MSSAAPGASSTRNPSSSRIPPSPLTATLASHCPAVPGEITSSLSAGTNGLLLQGAAPVTSVVDVLEAVGLEPPDEQPAGVDAVALPVLAALADGPRTADELTLLTGLAAGAVAAALVGLELDWRVAAADGTYRSTIAR